MNGLSCLVTRVITLARDVKGPDLHIKRLIYHVVRGGQGVTHWFRFLVNKSFRNELKYFSSVESSSDYSILVLHISCITSCSRQSYVLFESFSSRVSCFTVCKRIEKFIF